MRKGFTLLELLVVICVAAVLVAFWTPRAARLLDWIETERAVRDVTTALAVGRNGAGLQTIRARVTFAPDSIPIDRFAAARWGPWWRLSGTANPGELFAPGFGLLYRRTHVLVEKNQRLTPAHDPDQCLVDFGIEDRS